MIGLSPRQADVVRYLQVHPRASYARIAQALGLANKSYAYRLVTELVERGWVRRSNGRVPKAVLLRRLPGTISNPYSPAKFGTDPRYGNPTPYTGPYPILHRRTCADLIAEGVL